MTRTATASNHYNYIGALAAFLVLSACVDPIQNGDAGQSSAIAEQQKNAANELTFSCVIAKAEQYASTLGSPFELGALAANACETYINASAKAYAVADGNPRAEAINRESFKRVMAEKAAQMIVELRTR